MALSLPKKPKQSLWDKVRDVVDANSQMDQYKRAQAGQSTDYATQQRSLGNSRPMMNLGQQVVGNSARFLNTAAGAISVVPETIRGEVAMRTGNQGALQASLERQRFMNEQAFNPTGGLLKAGSIYNSPQEFGSISNAETAKRVGLNTLGTAAEVLPFAKVGRPVATTGKIALVGSKGLQTGSRVVKGIQAAETSSRLLPRVAFNAGQNVVSGAGTSAAQQYIERGQIDPTRLAGDTAASVALGAVGDVGGSLLTRGAKAAKAARPVDPAAELVNTRKNYQLQLDKATSPKEIRQIQKGIADLNAQIRETRRLNQGGYIKLPGDKQPTQKPVVTSKKPKVNEVSSIAQGRAVEAPVKPTSKEAFVPGEAKPVVNLKQTDALPTRMKGGTGPEYARDMNVKNYDLPEEDLKVLSDLSGKTVKRMKNTDIQEAAQFVGVDTTKLNDRETLAVLAGRLNQSKETTSRVAQIGELKKAGANEDQIRQAIADARKSIEIDQNQKTFAGRQLQMERIIKSKLSPEDKFIRMLVTSGADPNKIDDTLLNLDLSTPEAAVKAWRDAVPATVENWLDKYRYTNMLSSPLTHVVNIVGNLQSTAGVRPLTMAVTGALDAAKSAVTGKPRAQFAGEAPRYLKGAVQNVSKAMDEAVKSLSRFGEYAKNPDMIGEFDTPLAVGGLKGQADAAISFIPKLLNAGDIFFRTIAEGGETAGLNYRAGKGAFTGDIAEQATKNADYTLFRSKLGEKEQGYVLQALDFLPQTINRARNSDSVVVRNIAKATFPFVSTPTNIFKQGIEYSPAGFVTMAGNKNKTAQAAKALMGTTAVAMAAGTFAANDAITGAEPSDKAQRDAFRAEGKQPWSVKIGDKWVQYSKLHPAIAFNLATVASVKDAMDKGTIDQDGADKVMSMVGGVLGFYRDQSYFKGIGDFTNMIQGIDTSSVGDTASSVVGSTASQYLPLQSFNNWVGRLINDTQTKVDYSADFVQQTLQRLFKDYPAGGEMTGAPERENPYTGGPIEVENQGINAFSPLKVTNDKGFGNTTGLNVDERQVMQGEPDKQQFRADVMEQKGLEKLDKKMKAEMTDTDAEIRQGATGKFYAKLDGKITSFDTKEKADVAVAKDKFAKSDKNFEIVGETVFRKSATGEVSTTPKVKYDTDLTWAELTKHKNADNLGAWMTSAEKQLQNLDKQLQDPNVDELDRIKLENSAQGLIEDMMKYDGYAGFTKGKSGSGGSGGGSISATQFRSSAPKAKVSAIRSASAGTRAKYRVAKKSSRKPTVTMRKSKV